MHYHVNKYIIESELSAKSTKQTNKNVLEFISKLPSNYEVLDYGCGKLRYSIPLANQTSHVIAIDSIHQIEKKQIIEDYFIAPKDYALENLFVQNVDSNGWRGKKYDVVFCTNVLSAIPEDSERFKILCNARNVLKSSGYMYIVVQYRNSYFNQYQFRENAIKHNDGWLINRGNNKCSFYGMMTSEKIIRMCDKAGFMRYEIAKDDGSCYIKAYFNSNPDEKI